MEIFFQRVEWIPNSTDLRGEIAEFKSFASELNMKSNVVASSERAKVAMFVSKYDHCFHDIIVITSYSIHYTKLYETRFNEPLGAVIIDRGNHIGMHIHCFMNDFILICLKPKFDHQCLEPGDTEKGRSLDRNNFV